jgi:hypothetical protein
VEGDRVRVRGGGVRKEVEVVETEMEMRMEVERGIEEVGVQYHALGGVLGIALRVSITWGRQSPQLTPTPFAIAEEIALQIEILSYSTR